MTPRYPWPQFVRPWLTELEDIDVDGATDLPIVDSVHRRVRLDGTAWSDFECSLLVTTTEPLPRGISNFEGFAVVSCPKTNTRIPFALLPDGIGRLCGRIHVSSDELAGNAKVIVSVVSTIGGRQRTIGAGEEWVLVADAAAAPVPPGAPPFPSVWVDFSSDGAPEVARRSPTAYAIMDLSGDPRLLLNDGIPGLSRLLDAPRLQLERRRLRDLLGATIARDALTALFRAAVAEVAAAGEPNPPDDRILRQACAAVAGTMPGVADVDDLYERIVAAAQGSPRDWTLFWMETDAAIGLVTDLHENVLRVSTEVRHA